MICGGAGFTMGHHLTTFIGRREVLERLPVPGLRLLALPQGMYLAPMLDGALRALGEERDLTADEVMDELAQVVSAAGPIGWLMSDWFGGAGGTEVALWEGGRKIPATQNEMFAALGVVRVVPKSDKSAFWQWVDRVTGAEKQVPPLDEWDSLGLGGWRGTDRAYEVAIPVNSQWISAEKKTEE